jgi:phenylpyruvate tautomerase PptA (4-oxalocrotonate tautomerase family)
MPLVRIDVIGTKSDDYKRALMSAARRCIVEGMAAEDRRVTVRVTEAPAANVDLPACRDDSMTVLDILLYEGRSPEMKAATAAALRDALAVDPGIEPSEVTVFFHDATPVDLDVLPGQADL